MYNYSTYLEGGQMFCEQREPGVESCSIRLTKATYMSTRGRNTTHYGCYYCNKHFNCNNYKALRLNTTGWCRPWCMVASDGPVRMYIRTRVFCWCGFIHTTTYFAVHGHDNVMGKIPQQVMLEWLICHGLTNWTITRICCCRCAHYWACGIHYPIDCVSQ